jgi:hypothetical protein
VLFDNNTIQECYSNSLRVESLQSLPPDLPLLPDPVQQQEQPGTVVADTNIAPSVEEDDASEEDLPLHRPEDDEISEAAGEPDDEEQRPVGMIPRGEEHEPALRTYHRRKMEAQDKIRQLIGTTVREKSKNQSILWTVVEKHEPSEYIPPIEDNQSIGWTDYKKLLDTSKNTIFASLFLELMFKDKAHIKELVTKMNFEIEKARDSKVKYFTPEEFLIGIGLIIGASEFDQQGKKCWITSDHFNPDEDNDDCDYEFSSLVQHPNFDRYMSYCRFKDFRRFFPTIWHSDNRNESDPWWAFADAIDNFNSIRKNKITKSPWAIIDESMSAWRPRTTALGGLPNISHVPRKPEPLGTEFKCTACPATGCMIALEIQRGREGMKNRQYNAAFGNTAGCTLRLMDISGCKAVKGDAWFGSVRSCATLKQHGYESVLQVKQNHALYPKSFILETLNDAPGGVFVCLSGTAPNGIPLIALGYRYSRKTVLFFVMSSAAGSTKLGNPYKMKYTDGFGNLCERNVDRPEVISKFFEDSNVIDTHNHVRQFELAFEKKWLTKDPFFRLTTTIIGMCVTDAWRLASVHKLINNSRKKVCIDDEKKMAIKKFSGIVAFQLISTVSTLLSDDPMQVVSIFSVGEPKDENDDISQLNSTLSSESSGVIKVLRTLTDANHKPHRLVKLPRKRTENSRHKGTMARKCKLCQERGIRHDVVYYCLDCGENNNYCSLDQHNKTRDCFMEHVRSIKRCLPSRRVVRTTEV